MAHIRPNLYSPRSLQLLALLYALALLPAGPGARAQEPVAPDPDAVGAASEDADSAAPENSGEGALTEENFDEDDLDETVIAAGEAAMEVVARLEAELSMSDLVSEQRFAEAIPYAERVVELTEEELGISVQLGVALSNLGMIQRRAELYDVSEQNFLRAVDVIREAEGAFSDAVINPLIGLGINYQVRGDSMEAATIFEEARTVSRRVNGLMNEGQILILDHLSNTMVSMERYEEADEFQRTAMQLQERIHGTDTMEILPAIYKLAKWMRSSYRFNEERQQYTRAMDIIREVAGPEDIALVTPLRETGNSFRIQKFPEGRGISNLRRALEIAEAQPERDLQLIAQLLVDIGDWNTAFSKVGPTGEEYRVAWALLGELEDGDEIRDRWFSEPNYVLRENPSNRGLSSKSEPGVVPGHVLITFDVDDLGRTRNVTVVEAEPPGLKNDSTARAINRSRFRPRMVDGELVWARGLARNFTFHYLPQE